MTKKKPPKVEVINVRQGKFGVALPDGTPDELQLAVQNEATNTRYVLCLPRDWRIDLGMALLGADGCALRVSMTYPKPKKAQVDCSLCGKPMGRRKPVSHDHPSHPAHKGCLPVPAKK